MLRRRLAIVLLVVAVLVGWDLSRRPERQLSARGLVAAIDLYQATLSKGLARVGASCRFEPTCSRYGRAVIERYGTLRGGWLALARIARCGPWTPAGTVDPPPGGEEEDET
jgi:putative membrane protein insertion efficiency factor